MKNIRKFIKILDFSILGAIVVAAGISSGVILLKSKKEHEEYWNEKFDYNAVSTPVELVATLKEGKYYYNNKKAVPSLDDFDLKVKFLKYGTTDEYYVDTLSNYEYPFTISYAENFYDVGGDIKIGFKKLEQVINVTLTPVVADRIEVVNTPYTVYYQTGSEFNSNGMKVVLYYNDGSSKELKDGDYSVDVASPLTTNTENVTISYQEGEKVCTTVMPIFVTNDYDLGTIVGIDVLQTPYVENGANLSKAVFTPLFVYSSGNKVEAGTNEIEITNGSTVAEFGNQYKIDIRSRIYTDISGSFETIVRNTIEGESICIKGGKIVNETEYYVNGSGQPTSSGHTTKCAGDFGAAVKNGQNAYTSFVVYATKSAKTDLTLRCANSYLVKDSSSGLYLMKPLKINTIADLIVNESNYEIDNNVILAGCGPSSSYAPLYNIYSEFTFKNVPLIAGSNTIVLKFKPSTESALTTWGESPSTMNIDYFLFETKGLADPETKDIVSIAVDPYFVPQVGANLTDVKVPVFATTKDGNTLVLSENDFNIVWNTEKTVVDTGSLSCTITLRSNPQIKNTSTFNLVGEELLAQCEDATKEGTSKVGSETSFEYVNGVKTSNSVTVAKGMDSSTTSTDTSLLHTLQSNYNATYKLFVRCASANETSKSAPFSAPSYKLNDVVDIYVNNVKVTFDATIPAYSHESDTDCDWWSFAELLIGDVNLHRGVNMIKIVGKRDSALRNVWNEIPVPKFDYIKASI